MKDPHYLTRDTLAEVVARLQRILYYDDESGRWDPDIEYDSDTTDAVDTVLRQFGLGPDSDMEETERRLQSLAEQPHAAPDTHNVQEAADEPVYLHCGTSKKWSNINNQGFQGQVKALAEALGIDEAEKPVNETLEFHSED
jgi:hypothetical protein